MRAFEFGVLSIPRHPPSSHESFRACCHPKSWLILSKGWVLTRCSAADLRGRTSREILHILRCIPQDADGDHAPWESHGRRKPAHAFYLAFRGQVAALRSFSFSSCQTAGLGKHGVGLRLDLERGFCCFTKQLRGTMPSNPLQNCST